MGHGRHVLYVFAVLLSAGCVAAKAQVSAVVFDVETKRPVEGATIYINPRGSVRTDSIGRFAVYGECNGITVACQGYESRSMDRESVPDTLWMLPRGRRLDEVVVYGPKPKIGFDMDKVLMEAINVGGTKKPSGHDFLDAFRFKKRRQAKRRKKIEKILKDY